MHFANSSVGAWTGTLSISNWDGQTSGGGTDQIFVGGNSYSGLTHAQLNAIKFGVLPTGAILLTTGELVPNSGPLLPLPVLGDFDQDGSPDAADINAMLLALTDLSAYQAAKQLSDGDLLSLGDFDHSGVVDNRDIQPMLDYIAGLGQGSAAAVPEPAGFALQASGALHLIICRRRREPRSIDRETYDALPEFLLIGECRVHIEQPGFRIQTLDLPPLPESSR